MKLLLGLFSCFIFVPFVPGRDEPSLERGREALLGRAFNPVNWSVQGYEKLARRWASNPAETLADHFGLHPAPYGNHDMPMGLRRTHTFLMPGVTTDCLLCHGGSIGGKSYVGLGNSSLDLQSLFEELDSADGRSLRTPFLFCQARGTSEAGAVAVYLLSWRDPDLRLRPHPVDLNLCDSLCQDVPAWWLLKKKQTMYYTGSTDARSVRALMQFMLSPLNGLATFEREESTFADIQAFILSLEPPAYPLPIDHRLADRGRTIFNDRCARCHGTYGECWTYPNRIVPIALVGTDRTRFDRLSREAGEHYNRSWFAGERRGWFGDDYVAHQTLGYQAPPLDGIWATAPYFHNGSVPTVYDVLNSKSRPKRYTRDFHTDLTSYDARKLGWRTHPALPADDAILSPHERRKTYDTSLPGRGNQGHTFGDGLTETERWAVIEYLKKL
jgi:mono/diheme cytochrome c family protein